jgi:hypothetical protein
LVEGAARTNQSHLDATWLDAEVKPELAGLAPGLREHLAGVWLRMAELEHASIAAFARFTLELLALAAPPELISAAAAAMADETAHARSCYALASGYAGQTLGPGALDLQGALDACDLPDVVERAFIEGCVAETLAAIEAGEAAAHAVDPVVRQILGRIARDEARHAELGWRFLAWALPRDRSTLSRLLQHARQSLSASSMAPSFDALPAEELLAAGLLPEDARRQLRAQVLREVVVPCLDALLGRAARGSMPGDIGGRIQAIRAVGAGAE